MQLLGSYQLNKSSDAPTIELSSVVSMLECVEHPYYS